MEEQNVWLPNLFGQFFDKTEKAMSKFSKQKNIYPASEPVKLIANLIYIYID